MMDFAQKGPAFFLRPALPLLFLIFSMSNAQAEWAIHNFSDGHAVNMMADTRKCAGLFDAKTIVPPGESMTIKAFTVDRLCNFHAPCGAYVILAKSHEDAERCSGKTIAKITIESLKKDTIKVDVIYDEHYQVTANDHEMTITGGAP